jgi:ABC-2 type transport system permease protein
VTTRHRLRSLGTIAYLNGIVPMRTQPLYLINTLASPLAFLFFVTVASNGDYYPFGVTGGMVLTMLSIGTGLQSDLAHYRQDLKLQDLVVASPVEGPIYVAGMAVSELVYSLPGMALLVVLWVNLVLPTVSLAAVGTIIGVLLLVWAFGSALGFTLATWFEDVRETFVFSPLISIGLTVIPPVYYPVSAIPAALRPFAYLSPTTYAADLMHGTVSGITGHPPPSFGMAAIDWAVLVGFTVALFALAAFKARWRDP